MTVRSKDGPPTIEDAARQLGVPVVAVDRVFGVVTIDPKQGLYSVQVDAAQLPADASSDDFSGPFSNPRIEPFGPPRDVPPPGKKST
jgi:hypothetical protein